MSLHKIILPSTILAFLLILGTNLMLYTSHAPGNASKRYLEQVEAVKPLPIFGAWVCDSKPYNCTWSDPISEEDVESGGAFDQKYHWIIDRDSSEKLGQPSLNLVVLAFINPIELMTKFNSAQVLHGVPLGMNQTVVEYFKSRGVRVMLAIGGVAYNEDWNKALDTDPRQLGKHAAEIAIKLGVGIEINYEDPEVTVARMGKLEQFVTAYREIVPYDPSGENPAARLTIDLPIGNHFLRVLDEWAARRWLQVDSEPKMKLDYANSLVADRQFTSQEYQTSWQENIDGSRELTPPIPPLAPTKFTVSLYTSDQEKVSFECTNLVKSLVKVEETGQYVLEKKILGYMFWAVGNPIGKVTTYPPNSCENGLGAAATLYNIPIPMSPLPQD